MLSEHIIELLSHHRSSSKSYFPQPLSRFQLLGLLRASTPPSRNHNELSILVIDEELNNLEAQGEVLLGLGKLACVSQPTVLINNRENLVGVKFVGDRVYLRLAHQALSTGQATSKTLLKPQHQNVSWIRTQLKGIGIRCLTIEQSLDQLPMPRIPSTWSLKDQECLENPFVTYQGLESLLVYQPSIGTQRARWKPVVGVDHLNSLSSLHLLQTPNKEFLWVEQGQFFEITPDAANLAMFYMDQEANCPLKLAWDEQPGRLDLRSTYLPSAYAQIIWRLSQPDANHNRTRFVDTQNRPRVKAVLERLGCVLV